MGGGVHSASQLGSQPSAVHLHDAQIPRAVLQIRLASRIADEATVHCRLRQFHIIRYCLGLEWRICIRGCLSITCALCSSTLSWALLLVLHTLTHFFVLRHVCGCFNDDTNCLLSSGTRRPVIQQTATIGSE